MAGVRQRSEWLGPLDGYSRGLEAGGEVKNRGGAEEDIFRDGWLRQRGGGRSRGRMAFGG